MRIATLICLAATQVAAAPAFAQTSAPSTRSDLPASASILDIDQARRAEQGLEPVARAVALAEQNAAADAKLARTASVARRSPDADARSGVAASGFLLRAGTDDSSVSMTLSTSRDTIGSFGKTDFALVLTAPLDKETKEGALITRDGLPGGWGASVSISSISGSYRPLANRLPQVVFLNLGTARCDAKARADALKTNTEINQAQIDAKCGSGLAFDDWGKDYLTENEWKLYHQQDAADDQGFISQELLFWSLTGAVNVDDFNFADPTSFAKDEQRKVGYSLSGSLGFSPGPAQPFFLASAEYRESWKAPDEVIRCPAGTGGPVDCVTAVFAPPEKDVDYKLSALARIVNPFGPDLPIAVEIKGSFDANDDVLGVEMPIYTFLDDAGKLRGGVRFGWDSDKDKVAVGVFIGAPFTLFD